MENFPILEGLNIPTLRVQIEIKLKIMFSCYRRINEKMNSSEK